MFAENILASLGGGAQHEYDKKKVFKKKNFLNLEGGAGLAGYLIIKRIIYVSKPCVCRTAALRVRMYEQPMV